MTLNLYNMRSEFVLDIINITYSGNDAQMQAWIQQEHAIDSEGTWILYKNGV